MATPSNCVYEKAEYERNKLTTRLQNTNKGLKFDFLLKFPLILPKIHKIQS